MVFSILRIKAFEEAADHWAHLRVTRRERETYREKWREGRKERGREVRKERRDEKGRGLVITCYEHPARHPSRCSILGASQLLTLRILEQ